MTAEYRSQDPLNVKWCEGCSRKRLTTQTVDEVSLCSDCMREVPIDRRPGIAKSLEYLESSSPDDEHLLGVMISEERWRSLEDEANQAGLSISEYVRRILDRRADSHEYT